MSSCRLVCIAIKNTNNTHLSEAVTALALLFSLSICFLTPASSQTQSKSLITLDQAIALALEHNHALKAARTGILQNQAQEITANLRPNPVFSADTQFLPFFNPANFTADNIDQLSQFDVGISYLWERGKKRQRRFEAAQDQTAVTRFQVTDSERTTTFNVAQQFIAALLAKANVELATQDLDSFKQTVDIANYQYKVGQISEGDALKLRLQLLQFQSDLSSAQLARMQAMASLRQIIGYDAVPENYELDADLKFEPLTSSLDNLQGMALNQRPDLLAAKQGVNAAESQHRLAIANGKRDFNTSFDYSHTSGQSSASIFFSSELPIFDRNQGEKARTLYAITQAQETASETTETVMTDIRNAYEALKVNQQIVQLYESGYLKNSEDSRAISEYAYKKGANSLLDYLDAERSYRSTQLAYRQALAADMLSLEQLKEAVGVRRLP